MVAFPLIVIPLRFFSLLKARKSVDHIPPHRPSEGSEKSPDLLADYFPRCFHPKTISSRIIRSNFRISSRKGASAIGLPALQWFGTGSTASSWPAYKGEYRCMCKQPIRPMIAVRSSAVRLAARFCAAAYYWPTR